jgi:hypothetical protein
MRWDVLFADLEAQMGSELAAEERALRAEELRVDRGRRDLASRVADLGEAGDVALRLRDGTVVSVRPEAAGENWIGATADHSRTRVIVPTSAIVSASARERVSVDGRVVERTTLGIRVLLRDLARRRRAVTITTPVVSLHGTIDAVAGDHLELAVHAVGSARRPREVTAVELIPLTAIMSVSY